MAISRVSPPFSDTHTQILSPDERKRSTDATPNK